MPFKVFAILFVSSLAAYAQSALDSVRSATKGSPGLDITELGNRYAQLGYHFVTSGVYDSAVHYYRLSVAIEPNPDLQLLASNLNGMAVAFGYLSQPDSALYYYRRALAVYESIRDTLHAAAIVSNLAMTYKNLGLYDLSLQYGFDALRRHERSGEAMAVASTFNTISQVYVNTGDYESALAYARKVLAIRQRINYTRGEAMSYNNIGEIYLRRNAYDSALTNLVKSLRIKRESNDRRSLSTTLGNLGATYLLMNRMAEAQSHFREALELKIEFKDRIGEAICYDNLARIAIGQNQLLRAKELLTKADEILNPLSAPEPMKDHLEIWMKYFEKTRDYHGALQYHRKLTEVKDTLFSIEKAKSMNGLRVRYETDQKEGEIQRLEEQDRLRSAELLASRYLIYGLGATAFLTLVIAVLVFFNYRSAKRGKTMQELFNRELNHRVKNNLQLLSSFLSLQSEELTDEAAVVAVKSNQGRVNAMALIHKKLYLSDEIRTITLSDYLKDLTDFLINSYDYSTTSLNLKYHMPALILDVDKAISVGLIVNELVANSLKHALPGIATPELAVDGHVTSDKDLVIQISDNGEGFSFAATEGSEQSFGLKMVNLLLKDLRGKMTVSTSNGTVVEIKIPIR